MIAAGDYIEMLMPSHFGQSTDLLEQFAHELGVESREKARQRDPLEFVLNLNALLYSKIAYVPKSTSVDSPIDHALESRQGVCQDFAHIMIGLTRRIGIPCRYVSGYLFHKAGDKTRSAEGATHAWVETLLPGLGWVGLDPTNNVLAGERHVRTSVGRDYADVPPTKGVFKGSAESQLLVSVHVAPSDAPPLEPELGSRRLVPGVARRRRLDSDWPPIISNNSSNSRASLRAPGAACSGSVDEKIDQWENWPNGAGLPPRLR